MTRELNALLDEIQATGGDLAALAAVVDRETLEGLTELAKAAAATEWRHALNIALMEGVNRGK